MSDDKMIVSFMESYHNKNAEIYDKLTHIIDILNIHINQNESVNEELGQYVCKVKYLLFANLSNFNRSTYHVFLTKLYSNELITHSKISKNKWTENDKKKLNIPTYVEDQYLQSIYSNIKINEGIRSQTILNPLLSGKNIDPKKLGVGITVSVTAILGLASAYMGPQTLLSMCGSVLSSCILDPSNTIMTAFNNIRYYCGLVDPISTEIKRLTTNPAKCNIQIKEQFDKHINITYDNYFDELSMFYFTKYIQNFKIESPINVPPNIDKLIGTVCGMESPYDITNDCIYSSTVDTISKFWIFRDKKFVYPNTSKYKIDEIPKDSIVISFRGTNEWTEWLTDGIYNNTVEILVSSTHNKKNIKVHNGFYTHAKNIFDKYGKQICDYLFYNPIALVLVGHGSGSSQANIFHLLVWNYLGSKFKVDYFKLAMAKVFVYGYGGPAYCSFDDARFITNNWGYNINNIINDRDYIPLSTNATNLPLIVKNIIHDFEIPGILTIFDSESKIMNTSQKINDIYLISSSNIEKAKNYIKNNNGQLINKIQEKETVIHGEFIYEINTLSELTYKSNKFDILSVFKYNNINTYLNVMLNDLLLCLEENSSNLSSENKKLLNDKKIYLNEMIEKENVKLFTYLDQTKNQFKKIMNNINDYNEY